jgi:hypothetical protein
VAGLADFAFSLAAKLVSIVEDPISKGGGIFR